MDATDFLKIFAWAMTPIGELRLSIPLAIVDMGMPWYQALLLSLAGNMVPVLFLVLGLERIARVLQSFPNPLGRLLAWRSERLRRVHQERFRKYGAVLLVALVAIPLPFTGAWTGSLAAWVFQVPARTAIPLIALGVLIAGTVVTALTVAGVQVSIFLAHR
ncbi:MAG: COG2426 family protein [Dehalococcoidia bacterium]